MITCFPFQINFIGKWTTPIVKSLRNNAKNSIWDEVNLFRFVLIIPKINSKLAIIINGIKIAYTKINSLFLGFANINEAHLRSLWWNCCVSLFMSKSTENNKNLSKLHKVQWYSCIFGMKSPFKNNKVETQNDKVNHLPEGNTFPNNNTIIMCWLVCWVVRKLTIRYQNSKHVAESCFSIAAGLILYLTL